MRREEGSIADVVRYRMKQADDAVTAACILKDSGELVGATNRIYYGMFYMVTALALTQNFKTSKHQRLQGWFNKEFVATGRVNDRLGKALRNAFHMRLDGDYDALVYFEEDEVDNMLQEMRDFISAIKKLLDEYL
jgi:uncharacterized protein (UPF0332 family)